MPQAWPSRPRVRHVESWRRPGAPDRRHRCLADHIFYRSVTILILMGLWLSWRFGSTLPHHMVNAGLNAVIAGVAVGTAGLTFVIALFYTTVAQVIFMVGITPFLSAILGFWILRERIPPITWAAMTIALTGMGVIFYGTGSGGAITGTALALYWPSAFPATPSCCAGARRPRCRSR